MRSFSETFQNKAQLISRRMFVLTSLKIAVFIGIICRLFYLQISENIKWRSLSDKNRLREWKIAPPRGVIEDYFGNKIAINTQVFQLHMVPENVPNLEELFFRLSRIINFDKRAQNNLLKRLKKRKPWEPIIISDNLSWSEFSKLNLFLHEIQGIKPVVALARKYLEDGTSSHVIGYVSEMSVKDLENSELLREINIPGLKTGKNGLEKSLNDTIIGRPGLQRFEVNAYGKRINELKFVKGTSGKNYRTTLDIEVQNYAKELLKDKSGSLCIMDIYSGEIIAMVSSPTFDANKFVHGITSEDWKELINNERKPLMNKSITGLYPPGSTLKPLVALSALENDVISPNTTRECRGSIELYGHTYHCWKEKGHGFVRLRDAIKQSCDIYFYEVARRLGVDRLAETANKFGLGKGVIDILNDERSGLVPTTKWKLKNIGKGWVLGETLLAGIGQGYYQVTPIQLCLMTAQLANGGYEIKSKLIYDEKDVQLNKNEQQLKFKKLYRNQENIKFVLDAQFGATNEPMGTSFRSRHLKSKYVFAGKTGTSQTRSITPEERRLKTKQKDLPYKRRDHALFTAFAPYKNPRYALSIVIEHGGTGSSAAAPIAKKIIKKVIDRDYLRKRHQTYLLQEI
jgi:penicillin-binding protein 2